MQRNAHLDDALGCAPTKAETGPRLNRACRSTSKRFLLPAPGFLASLSALTSCLASLHTQTQHGRACSQSKLVSRSSLPQGLELNFPQRSPGFLASPLAPTPCLASPYTCPYWSPNTSAPPASKGLKLNLQTLFSALFWLPRLFLCSYSFTRLSQHALTRHLTLLPPRSSPNRLGAQPSDAPHLAFLVAAPLLLLLRLRGAPHHRTGRHHRPRRDPGRTTSPARGTGALTLMQILPTPNRNCVGVTRPSTKLLTTEPEGTNTLVEIPGAPPVRLGAQASKLKLSPCSNPTNPKP